MAKRNGGTRATTPNSLSSKNGVVPIASVLNNRNAQSYEYEKYFGNDFMFGKEITIPISVLIPTQDTVNMNKVKEIAKSPEIIDRKDGWRGKSSIEVVEHNGKYYINDGHHRVTAAKLLKRKNITANVIKK